MLAPDEVFLGCLDFLFMLGTTLFLEKPGENVIGEEDVSACTDAADDPRLSSFFLGPLFLPEPDDNDDFNLSKLRPGSNSLEPSKCSAAGSGSRFLGLGPLVVMVGTICASGEG